MINFGSGRPRTQLITMCRSLILFILLYAFMVIALAQDSTSFKIAGDQAFQNKEYQQALINYKKAIKQDDSDAQTHASLASVYEHRQDDEQTRLAATRSLELDADQFEALMILARLEMRQGNYGDSIEYYKKAVNVNPDDIYAQAGLVEAYKLAGMSAMAAEKELEFERD